jgi:hypothetical protein
MTAPTNAPPRSAALTLSQAILVLEALAALFATAYLASASVQADAAAGNAGQVWGVGIAVVVALVAAAGAQRRPLGRTVGWILQVPLLAAAIVSIPVAVVGLGFVALWFTALRIGDRIDRERAAFLASAAPTDGGAP